MSEIVGNFERGAELFRVRCSECHAIEPKKASTEPRAPNLSGLYGSSPQSFKIHAKTREIEKVPFTWNDATIDQYLQNPETIRPGVEKIFEPVTKEQDRKDLIAYLKGMSEKRRM
ncbi:unnamed protein product [Rhizoctonia solani]|uniref:Cytochrome c domain-containing protein n=1 Tax=Rhizoctonia solani TaxID=456999 RepID=A0A8H3H4K4_9AGAM|nr:unnamed protein product [Rhizoctonia solani]